MAEDSLCSHCGAWLCRADDAWCGYCGQACARLQLDLKPSVLYAGTRSPRIVCKLTNHSCAPLKLEPAKHPEWITLASEPTAELPAGGSAIFFATAKTQSMQEPRSGEIVIATSVGVASSLVMAIEEKPKFRCDPPTIVVWSEGDHRQIQKTLKIRPDAGKIRVRAAQLHGLDGQLHTEQWNGGLVASPESGGEVTVAIDATGLACKLFETKIQLDYDAPHGLSSSNIPLTVRVCRPPQLLWEGEDEKPKTLYQTDCQPLKLKFCNKHPNGRDGGSQNAELVIQSVTLTAPEGKQIGIQLRTAFPLVIPGGADGEVEFFLDLTSEQGRPASQLNLAFKVQTNLPAMEKTVTLLVEPRRVFPGTVAIDFGSSNTCCAFVESGCEPELLHIDVEGMVSPTVVRYVDVAVTPPIIEIGSVVKRRASISSDFAASVADGLKQMLREARQEISIRPEHPKAWTTRKASAIAADYLKQIRHIAENRKSAIFQNFILTHPARCPLQQHRRLRLALSEAFGTTEGRVYYLSEPIAALIPLLVKRAEQPQRSGYIVASFDLGGGTTDAAVIQIDYKTYPSEIVEIVPAILHCTGSHFGGDNLTAFLVSEMERRCSELLQAKKPGATLITESTKAAAALDMRLNRTTMREKAEQFKTSLSTEVNVKKPVEINLRIKEQDGQANEIRFTLDEISKCGGRDLSRLFLEHTRTRVQEIAVLLKEAIGDLPNALDLIHVSGKTAQLAVVGDTIREIFPNVAIETSLDPKECVVKGACLSRSLERGKLRLNLPDTTQRMTSSIGLFTPQNPYFVSVLCADAVIPEDGLQCQIPDIWNGKESIDLWEDVDGNKRNIDYRSAAQWLENLGSWVPAHAVALPDHERWPLRLTMKDFELSVTAIGPNDEQIPFQPTHQDGE